MSYSYKFLDPSVVLTPGTKPKIRRTNGLYDRTVMRNFGHGVKFVCVVFKNRRSEVEIPIFDLTTETKSKLDKEHPDWRNHQKKEKLMKKLT
jgi:hypothetical protein